MAVGLVVLGIHAIHDAQGAAGDHAVFQPADADWRLGESLRVCATEAPTGAGTLTAPDASTTTPVGDGEGCFSVTPDQEGSWTLSWPVAGPATRSVSFQVWGPALPDTAFWIELVFWIVVVGAAMYHGAWFVAGFALTGSFHLMAEGWLYDLEAVLPFLFLGVLLEWGAHRMKFKKKK